jgi:hypothetical protein
MGVDRCMHPCPRRAELPRPDDERAADPGSWTARYGAMEDISSVIFAIAKSVNRQSPAAKHAAKVCGPNGFEALDP